MALSYGLCGLMEGHHYGAYHSFISELSKEMGWSPRRPFHEHLDAILVREFGRENLADARRALEHASEGAIKYAKRYMELFERMLSW